MASTAYCEVGDLLIGDIPTPVYIDKQKFVDDAADEIDSWLGARYVTPIVLTESLPAQRPSFLTLKRVNAHLASGRLLLSAAAGGEDTDLHRYGWQLVNDALAALRSLLNGEPIIVGAIDADHAGSSTPAGSLPLIVNGDPYSQVDGFYEILTPGQTSVDPAGYYPLGLPVRGR